MAELYIGNVPRISEMKMLSDQHGNKIPLTEDMLLELISDEFRAALIHSLDSVRPAKGSQNNP